MHFFRFSHLKVYYFAPNASAFGKVKPDVSQSEAMFHKDVRFATLYRRIIRSKIFDVIQSDNMLHSYVP